MKKMSNKEIAFQIFDVIFMLFLALITLYPLWYIIVASFSDNGEVIRAAGKMLWFKEFTTDAYREVLKLKSIWTGYRNTLFILIIGTTLNIIMTCICAYFLSRKNVYWQKFFAPAILFTMYFSGGMIPFYFTVKDLNLTNSLFSLIIPFALSTYNVIIMRSAFLGIPDSLSESASIDGARHVTILFKILMPLCMPTIAVLILYYGVGHWNGWFHAMIFMKDRDKYPLQLVLREIVLYNTAVDNAAGAADRAQIGETIQYASIVVATLPILCIYPFLQKFFEKGVMIGAIKG